MELFPYVLVIISAITHGIWNFLAKRGDKKDIFIGLSKLSEVVVFLGPFLILLSSAGIGFDAWYVYVTIAACFVFLNYFFLAQAYKQVEFSIAYPISRSSTLFLPILGYLFVGERIDSIGLSSIILISIGVLGLQLNSFEKEEFVALFQKLVRPGIIFAILAALTLASYTIWDKVAVTHIHPFLYFYSYTALTSLIYVFFLWTRFSKAQIKNEWQRKKSSIVLVAVLNTFTYLLVLTALSFSKATYVGAMRQLSLVVGIVLGWRILNESLSIPRIISIVLLVVGSGLIAFAE